MKSRAVEFVGVPIRTCICCRCKRPKDELIRVCVDGDGKLTLDGKGKKPGRGSYICRDAGCIDAARKSAKVFGRSVSDSIFRELESLVGGSRRESDIG